MATFLHDIEVYVTLAEGEAGPARDWATTRLALYAPERYRTFPDDERCHDVLLSAAPSNIVESMITVLNTGPITAGLANATAALGVYGLFPEHPEALTQTIRGALRKGPPEADVWLAYAASMLHAADRSCLSAAAEGITDANEWVLPLLILRVAETAGALDVAAVDVAADIWSQADRDPHRLLALLVALGIPLSPLARSYREVEAAISVGAAVAHQPAPILSLPPGSLKRRHQAAVIQLLDGVPGPAAALLRAVYQRKADPRPEWNLWPVAIASWLRVMANGVSHGGLHDVLHHGLGGDPDQLSSARRQLTSSDIPDLLNTLEHHPDIPALVLAVAALRQTPHAELARVVLRQHGGQRDLDIRTIALACVAATSIPDDIPSLLSSPDSARRALGLVAAEWVPTTEVLEALLQLPVPADPTLKLQYVRALASTGDQATLPILEALKAGDTGNFFAEPLMLAQELLRTTI